MVNALCLTTLTVLLLASPAKEAPRVDWAAALVELPALAQYAPMADAVTLRGFGGDRLFARVGGRCVRLIRRGRSAGVRLGEGVRDGHSWRWELDVTLAPEGIRLEGPVAIHGLDRKGDGRTFRHGPRARSLFAGPPVGDRLPLHEEAHRIEIACWGEDRSTARCPDGSEKECHSCSVVRVLGGPRGGQRVYGDGVLRADLTRGCEDACTDPGLPWPAFEALVRDVGRVPVVLQAADATASLFATEAACVQAGEAAELAEGFSPVEPAIPPR